MIVVNKDRALTDLTFAQLGYYNQEEFITIAENATAEEQDFEYKDQFTYEEIVGKEFIYYYNDDVFVNNTANPQRPFEYNFDMTGSQAQGIPRLRLRHEARIFQP